MSFTLRRLRQNEHIRSLTREVTIETDRLIQPLFGVEGINARETIPGLTDVYRDTRDSLFTQIEKDLEVGVTKFLLFGIPKDKSAHPDNFEFTAGLIGDIKAKFKDSLWLAVDVCMCSSTEHGHCGVIATDGKAIDNQKSVEILGKMALAYAKAGADCVAPSDMMDGRIGEIRRLLNEHGLDRTLLMSYSAKFHSKFYGPFRIAADSKPQFSDRSSYQIDPARPSDAVLSSKRDAKEGADILMVKPGLPYLDVLAKLSAEIPLPWAVYEVSGEFAAIELMAREGLIDGPKAHLEAWTALFRAGASIIITYGARKAQTWLS